MPELITEFYALFEFHDTHVMFQLGEVMRRLIMPDFGVPLSLWTVEEQTIDIYATTVRDFTEDGAPFIQFKVKGTDLIPILHYSTTSMPS